MIMIMIPKHCFKQMNLVNEGYTTHSPPKDTLFSKKKVHFFLLLFNANKETKVGSFMKEDYKPRIKIHKAKVKIYKEDEKEAP